jgi:hypothetical protein
MARPNKIETLCMDKLPNNRLPTTEEIALWVKCPDNYPELNDYMLARPELVMGMRTIIDFNKTLIREY